MSISVYQIMNMYLILGEYGDKSNEKVYDLTTVYRRVRNGIFL